MFRTIFICILSMFSLKCKSQKDPCSSLNTLLGSADVIFHFKLSSIKDSTIFLIDRNHDFSECNLKKWGNKNLKIMYDSSISMNLKKVSPFWLFKDQCNYFIIMEYEEQENILHYSLLNPCSGLLYSADLKKSKSNFVITNIKKGVI